MTYRHLTRLRVARVFKRNGFFGSILHGRAIGSVSDEVYFAVALGSQLRGEVEGEMAALPGAVLGRRVDDADSRVVLFLLNSGCHSYNLQALQFTIK